jgi:hypothetical protein
VLCITGGGVPPEKIDIFWHAHILHSSSYLQMCKDVFEGKYLMHMPGGDKELLRSLYTDTLRRYEKYFGNPPSVWSRDNLSPANHCLGCSCCGPDPSNKTFIIQ